jgi:hypothetical protein
MSTRALIIREMNEVLRSQQGQGIGSGLARKERWKTEAGTDLPDDQPLESQTRTNGNSLNAAVAAENRTEVVSRHFLRLILPFV